MDHSLKHVFVYGTLKRGQCRENCWPLAPQRVRAGWTFGRLFDLGAYPALLEGKDRIAGEVWSYCELDLPRVLQVLDQIEVTGQPGIPNEYDRIQVPVTLVGGHQTVLAETYRFADPHYLQCYGRPVAVSVRLDNHQCVTWPVSVHQS
ncbi:MAG: gamma-glutamylcyclotransferase [Pirellulaceae bacterium]|nr:gamma-glutamylcyclotransferase [Pirellulaceae bacterium]